MRTIYNGYILIEHIVTFTPLGDLILSVYGELAIELLGTVQTIHVGLSLEVVCLASARKRRDRLRH